MQFRQFVNNFDLNNKRVQRRFCNFKVRARQQFFVVQGAIYFPLQSNALRSSAPPPGATQPALLASICMLACTDRFFLPLQLCGCIGQSFVDLWSRPVSTDSLGQPTGQSHPGPQSQSSPNQGPRWPEQDERAPQQRLGMGSPRSRASVDGRGLKHSLRRCLPGHFRACSRPACSAESDKLEIRTRQLASGSGGLIGIRVFSIRAF